MRERNRRAREYSRRCWARRWNRRLWILNILLGLAITGILLWALTLPEAQEPEDAPPPLSAAVQSAVLSAKVAGTGVFSQNVEWSFEPSGDAVTEVSSGTYMTGSTLFIGKDEQNKQFTVTATSVQDGEQTGQATITVKSA